MKRLLVAALFASAIGLTGAPAVAGHCFDGDPANQELPPDWDCDVFHEEGGCGYDSVQQETATGQNFEGVAYGYATDLDGGTVSIRCYVTVNGVPASAGSTPTGTGTGLATTAGPISFEAADGADVRLCTEVNGVTTECNPSTNTQIPPQEVVDLIADATSGLDPIICGILQTLGIPAIINSTTAITGWSMDADDCDLYYMGDRVIDFVPYED